MTEVDPRPGRSCPLNYHYGPRVFRRPPPASLAELEVLYVVGGLYGNELALAEVFRLFEAESGRKRLVFNGDFHWFDVDAARFDRVQQQVLSHEALRGNVETELALASETGDAGCGCAYPDWVGDGVVERSNRILDRLRGAVLAEHRQALARLPMCLTASVGALNVGIVHGDAQSLAGWGFAQEHLAQASYRLQARQWFEQAGVDVFACTHTCLPVFQEITAERNEKSAWVLNNGAAGMPNFRHDLAGLLTRIALSPPAAGISRAGIVHRGVYLDAVAIQSDRHQALQQFLSQWPEGSDAHFSYFDRIATGPEYSVDQLVRRHQTR